MSETELMAKWLRSIQEDGGEDVEEKVVEWKARTINNTIVEFKHFSSTATSWFVTETSTRR